MTTHLIKSFYNANTKKSAFTFAEALITMLIIGIAAAMVIPPFFHNAKDKTLATQQSLFEKKLKEGLRRMALNDELAKDYSTTEDFINNMQKYFKITATCDNEHLSKCFSDLIRKDDNGNILWRTDKLRTTKSISSFPLNSNLVGIIFHDGSRAIIGYNPHCIVSNDIDNETDFTRCLALYYDVNGNQNPNILNKDIFAVNADTGDLQIGTAFKPTLEKTCEEIKALGVTNNGQALSCPEEYNSTDYWANAVYKCYQEGKHLPTKDEFKNIATKLYAEPISGSEDHALTYTVSNLSVSNSSIYQTMGSPASVRFWTSDAYPNSKTTYFFYTFSAKSVYQGRNYRSDNSCKAICVE